MDQYLKGLKSVYTDGIDKGNRTGINTRSIFGTQTRYDLTEGFPLVTTKQVSFKFILHELLWFIKGETNIQYLKDNKVTIWDEWATEAGDLGPIYGKQWRSWPTSSGETIDQLANVVERLKVKPDCRRLIVSAWNPEFIPNDDFSPQENVEKGNMALAPCHTLFQFYSVKNAEGNRDLSLQIYIRSQDKFLGEPYNIASYAILLMMVAQLTGMHAKELVYTNGDSHIYHNHFEQVEVQLARNVLPLPKLTIANREQVKLEDFIYEDFILTGYDPHPAIKGEVAV